MKITCTQSTEVKGSKIEKSCTVELPDDSLEAKSGEEANATLKTIIQEVFDGIKS
jgi:hypothetical protein